MSEMLEEIPTAHLDYATHNGAVGDWLVLGPVVIPLAEPSVMTVAARRDIIATYLARVGEMSQPPAERAKCRLIEKRAIPLKSCGEWSTVERTGAWILPSGSRRPTSCARGAMPRSSRRAV